jgi:uncharacterized protein (DUF2252 family)
MPVNKKILEFNKDRIPALLSRKYAAMRSNPFVFFRGTCHLFYDDLAKAPAFKDPTRAWICGDLHLENFGTYKGDNRAAYFDLNDFDEAVLAPCTWELARVLTSIWVAAGSVGYSAKDASFLSESFLNTYVATLRRGKAGAVEKDTVRGLVRKFLLSLKLRSRSEFIGRRTVLRKGKLKLRIDNERAMELGPDQKKLIVDFFDDWRSERPDRKFFKVHDAAIRIAGTGSLGVERYIVLVRGNGPGQEYLLDLKKSSSSCLNKHLKIKQPVWKNEAERITQIQDRVQAVSPALLHDARFNGRHFVLKELQPIQDKMSLSLCKGKLKKMEELICIMAQVTAFGHLRASGRQGSSITDELIEFSMESHWKKQVLHYALEYSKKVESDFMAYTKAYDEGFFAIEKANIGKKKK